MIAKHLLPLRNKAIGKLTFSNTGLLHVGSGGKEARREMLTTRKNGKRLILLPSSSIKGTIRSLAEHISRSVGTTSVPDFFYMVGDEGLRIREGEKEKAVEWLTKQRDVINTLFSLGFGDDLEKYGIREGSSGEKLREIPDEELVVRMAERYATTLHPLYRLFGGPSIAAKVRFLDSLFEARLAEKAGIAIDRRSGRILERHLYFCEALLPGNFNIWFIADNLLPGEEDSRLFALTLEFILENGLWIGARKSTGMGRLELERGEVWLVETEKDENGRLLSNPWRDELKKDLQAFLKYLRPS
jgi:CRISPR/Cas system CSM-associated protein Csm3 (group 7 of RAMP superfamily)